MQNIAVVFGGKTVEHDISIITGLGVIKNLSLKYNIIPIYIDKSGEWYSGEELKTAEYYSQNRKAKQCQLLSNKPFLVYKKGLSIRKIKIDCAVLALHGGIYEGGGISAVFALSNIPTTSAGFTGNAICMDKALTKNILNSIDILTPKSVCGENFEEIKAEIVLNELKYPLIVKPSRAGSSIGIQIVNYKKDLSQAVEYAQNYDKKVIVEECLKNFRELNISLFRYEDKIKCSDIEEVFCENMFTFKEKYEQKTTKREVPAKLTESQIYEIENSAIKAYKTLDLSGVVRCDFMICEDKIYLNEINTIPGSLAFYLWRSKGIGFSKLLNLNIEQAIKNFNNQSKLTYDYNSNVLKDLSKIDKIIEK